MSAPSVGIGPKSV